MKKSNALMLAYIIILLLTVLGDIFTGWEDIEQIALAATIAGGFFAFADLTNWYVTSNLLHVEALYEKLKIHVEFCNTMKASEDKKHGEIEWAVSRLKKYPNVDGMNNIINACQSVLDKFISNAKALNDAVNENKILLEQVEKKIIFYKNKAKIERYMSICAFLSFFIITIFDKLNLIISPYESLITVIAFAIIILTYYFRDILDDEAQKSKNETLKYIDKQQKEITLMKDELQKLPVLELVNRIIISIKEEEQSEAENNG